MPLERASASSQTVLPQTLNTEGTGARQLAESCDMAPAGIGDDSNLAETWHARYGMAREYVQRALDAWLAYLLEAPQLRRPGQSKREAGEMACECKSSPKRNQ